MTKTRDDVEYLQNLPTKWWMNPDTVIQVGETLSHYGYVTDPWNYMRRPQAYQTAIDEFVREWKDG